MDKLSKIINKFVKDELIKTPSLNGYSNALILHHKNKNTQNKLYEGLITTQPISSVFIYFNKKFNGNIKLYKQSNDILNVNLTPFAFKQHLYNDIIQLMNNLGWFISNILYYSEDKGKMLNTLNFDITKLNSNMVTLQFEPKFDLLIDKLPKHIYHITKTINVDKIEKYGLIPKSKNKITQHNNRVYFILDTKQINILAKLLYPKETEISVIDIETKYIKNIRFMKDVNTPNGIFTLENIPPNYITSIEKLTV